MITTSVLMCHAPIVIPEVGGPRAAACSRTTRSMRRAARHVVDKRPDVVVVISPHAPRDRLYFGIAGGARMRFDFARFGRRDLELSLPGAPEAAERVRRAATEAGIRCVELREHLEDHGSAVPLHFFREAGWDGPTLLVALPYPGTGTEVPFGEALKAATTRSGERWAVLASGDLSHRLLPDAPAGFHPEARLFDEGFVTAIAHGDYRAACQPDPRLQELAAEDAVASTLVSAAATGFDDRGHRLLSYEGPFGVGYAEAILFDGDAPPAELADVARNAVQASLTNTPYTPVELAPPWHLPRAVFVTLRDHRGALRGCIGRLEPERSSLAREVARTAISAANDDPRFPPLTATELPTTCFEVSVLEPPQPISDPALLDPELFGIVVSDGSRRGVLLPNVPGIDTVESQLRTAKQKAGIGAGSPCKLERFQVHKVASPAAMVAAAVGDA